MDRRREVGRVVGVRLLPARESAHTPVAVGRLEGGRDPAEVLARRDPAELDDPGVAEVRPERRRHRGGDLGVVVRQGKLVVVVERRRLRRARGVTLGADDPLDAAEHPLADLLIVGTHVDEQNRAIGDDVALRTGDAAADRDHGELPGLRLAGHDRLQPQHDGCGEYYGVDTQVRHRAVRSLAEHGDPDAVPCREDRTGLTSDDPCLMVEDVLAEGDVRARDLAGESVVEHGLRAGGGLLGGLEERDERAAPGLSVPGQQRGRSEETGDVDIVPARMRDTDGRAGLVHRGDFGCVRQPGQLGHRQGVDIGAHEHGRTAAVGEDSHDATTDVLQVVAGFLEAPGDLGHGLDFVRTQLRMGVEMAVELLLPRSSVVDPLQQVACAGHRAHLLATCTPGATAHRCLLQDGFRCAATLSYRVLAAR